MSQIVVYKNISELLTLKGALKKQARGVIQKDLGVVKNAILAVQNGKIIFSGSQAQFKKLKLKKIKTIDLKGHTVMPGFIESHTHLIFGGDRKDEFEMRNNGATYSEIAKKGGGILSTVKATRKASEKELLILAQERVNGFVNQGITTLEVKSGYALDHKNEIKMLKVASKLKGPDVIKTYLGAHALPKIFKTHDDYIKYILNKVLPDVAQKKLAQRVDIFIDEGYFQKTHGSQLFESAKDLGLNLTLHADQMILTKAYELAIQYDAQSADHLVQLKSEDVHKLAKSNVTCNLLPGADLYLKMPYPPARELVDSGARISLATDFNPGSCPTQDLSLIGVLARLKMNLSLAEVICAYTLGASYALGLQNQKGALVKGYDADFITLKGSYKDLFYNVGVHKVVGSWKCGKKLKI